MRSLSLTVWAVVIAAVVTSSQVSQADFDTERNVNNFPKLEAPPQGEHKVAVDAVPGMRRAENFRPTPPSRGSRPRPQTNQPGSQRPTPNQNQNPGNGQGAPGECLASSRRVVDPPFSCIPHDPKPMAKTAALLLVAMPMGVMLIKVVPTRARARGLRPMGNSLSMVSSAI